MAKKQEPKEEPQEEQPKAEEPKHDPLGPTGPSIDQRMADLLKDHKAMGAR